MTHWLVLALAAGAASGLLNGAAAAGAPMGLFLSHLTMLPLFLAGLGIGLAGAFAAGIAGALVFGAFAGPVPALIYAAVNALPVVVLTRQALLARPGAEGTLEWYPGGLLLCWLMGIVASFYALTLVSFELFEGGLVAAVRELLEVFAQAMGENLPPRNADALAAAAPLVPGFAAIYYMVNVIFNAALAQHLLRRSGRNLRPSIAFAKLTLPLQLLWVLLAAVLFALISPALAPVAYTLVFIIVVAYFLLGLAVVHAFLQNRPNRSTALFSFYVMLTLLMLLFAPIGVAVVGLGVIEQLMGLRRRFPGGSKEDA